MSDQISGVMTEAAAQPAQVSNEAAQTQDQVVPLSALQAERQQRQQVQEQLRLMQDHVELLQKNTSREEPRKDQFNDLSDEDVLTVGQAKKFVSEMSQRQNAQVEELKMATQYPDYAETVKKYLPELIKENPELLDAIKHAPNPYKTAYTLAKKSDSYLKDRGLQKSPEAQKVMQQQQRAGNLSSVGSPAPATGVSTWKNMSEGDFQKHVSKHLGYF